MPKDLRPRTSILTSTMRLLKTGIIRLSLSPLLFFVSDGAPLPDVLEPVSFAALNFSRPSMTDI
jgi:hypothetical protein